MCGRAKTEVYENDLLRVKKNNQYGWKSGIRWSSVDGRKRCKKASEDEKRFIRFQEVENGAFPKRISVDRA